ncbi:MAG: phosphoribosylaminoimidazolesuccinocarboxamide synthase [Luminiphilus sp.]|nr:phosphoribosylaminoimidazolesuccinocarboxamide synthase [Luminiphilus sp.]
MSAQFLERNDDFNIPTNEAVHSGKVRSVYWLRPEDSRRLIEERNYPVSGDADLAILIVSDRLSAFDCIWRAEGGLNAVPGKGAALNAVSQEWFNAFAEAGLARSHILEAPHPLVWIVQRAKPVHIEAIARQYITGSLWRAYAKGERVFCGNDLPNHLAENQRLGDVLITPSSKGVLAGLEGIPAVDDVNISREDIERHWSHLGFEQPEDIDHYERLLREGFAVIAERLRQIGQLFVDTKFEFGYAMSAEGTRELIYMDEVGTPDSSRIWNASAYAEGRILENSKEGFRQALLSWVPDGDLLLDKHRMVERTAYARTALLPQKMLLEVSETYLGIAAQIVGSSIPVPENPRAEIKELLSLELGLV